MKEKMNLELTREKALDPGFWMHVMKSQPLTASTVEELKETVRLMSLKTIGTAIVQELLEGADQDDFLSKVEKVTRNIGTDLILSEKPLPAVGSMENLVAVDLSKTALHITGLILHSFPLDR